MKAIQIDIKEIPHGHGLSFKKGVADGLLEGESNKFDIHETHLLSYQRGVDMGLELKHKIATHVKA